MSDSNKQDQAESAEAYMVHGRYERCAFRHLSSAEAYMRGLLKTDPEGGYVIKPLIYAQAPQAGGSGMAATVLATQLAEAVRKDEQGDGIDISAGIFGPHTSALIREVAALATKVTP